MCNSSLLAHRSIDEVVGVVSAQELGGAVAEWLAYRFMDLHVTGSNPGSGTFSTRINLE